MSRNERIALWLFVAALAGLAFLILRRRSALAAAGEESDSFSLVTGDIGHEVTIEDPRFETQAWRRKDGPVWRANMVLTGSDFLGCFRIPANATLRHDPDTNGPEGLPYNQIADYDDLWYRDFDRIVLYDPFTDWDKVARVAC